MAHRLEEQARARSVQAVLRAHWHPSGDTFVTATATLLQIRCAKSLQVKNVVRIQRGMLTSGFSACGLYFLGYRSNTVQIFWTEDWTVRQLTLPDRITVAPEWRPLRTQFLVGQARQWCTVDIASRDQDVTIAEFAMRTAREPLDVDRGTRFPEMVWTPCGNLFAVTAESWEQVQVWDVSKQRLVWEVEIDVPDMLTCLAWNERGTQLLVSHGHTITTLDVRSRRHSVLISSSHATVMRHNPLAPWLARIFTTKVHLMNRDTGCGYTLPFSAFTLEWSPDGTRLCIVSCSGRELYMFH